MSSQVAAVTIPSDECIHSRTIVEPSSFLNIEQYQCDQLGRDRLEIFVRQVFRQAYAAQISTFYPHLIGITRPDNTFAAVAGIRSASQEALFAEYYLDTPIEAQITRHAGQTVGRTEIAEVGNLAPASAGQARWLIAALTAYLHATGYTWVVFTAVSTLFNAFTRMGLRPIELAAADVSRLDPALQDDWGSYYDAKPVVYAGEVSQGFHALNRVIDPRSPHLWALWHDALMLGALTREHRLHVDMVGM